MRRASAARRARLRRSNARVSGSSARPRGLRAARRGSRRTARATPARDLIPQERFCVSFSVTTVRFQYTRFGLWTVQTTRAVRGFPAHSPSCSPDTVSTTLKRQRNSKSSDAGARRADARRTTRPRNPPATSCRERASRERARSCQSRNSYFPNNTTPHSGSLSLSLSQETHAFLRSRETHTRSKERVLL